MNMFSNFTIFNYVGQSVHVAYRVNDDGGFDPWFNLSDLCKILDLSNPTRVAGRIRKGHIELVPTEVQTGAKNTDGSPATRIINVNYVDETGLYVCILRSRKDDAEDFSYYVAGEVLPELRRNGGYVVGMETLPDQEKESLRREIKELQEKYDDLNRELQEANDLYADLFTRTKERVGVAFALGCDEHKTCAEYVINNEGFVVNKSIYLKETFK